MPRRNRQRHQAPLRARLLYPRCLRQRRAAHRHARDAPRRGMGVCGGVRRKDGRPAEVSARGLPIDKRLLEGTAPVMGTVRVRENWFSGSPSMCHP